MTYRDHPIEAYQDVIGATTQLIDVREPHELAEGALPGAVNIPLATLDARLHQLDPSQPVAVVCRSGGRSSFAAQQLAAAGFDDVINLAGGMLALADHPTTA